MKLAWVYKIAVFLWLNHPAFSKELGRIPQKDYENKNYFLLELKDNTFIDSVRHLHPAWHYEYQIPSLESFHVFSSPKNESNIDWFSQLDSLDDIIENSSGHQLVKREHYQFIESLHKNQVGGIHPLHRKRLVKRAPVPIDQDPVSIFERKQDSSLEQLDIVAEEFHINDPIFKEQWHILNTAFPGHDVNVVPVWRMNITGKGVVTALIDDGLDYESLDLKENYSPEGSWDYNDNRPNPMPMLENDYHGTRCAGEIAAAKGNEYCGVGVAYDSKVAGIRILSAEITAEEEAAAMIYGLDVNDIYSCSWGPPDNGRSMDVPDKIVRSAMLKGIQEGRGGKGALYVFASGNGAARGDSCNFDGYTNSIYSLTVSAIDHKGLHPLYSESCTAVMVSTYSSGSGEHIHTTDIKGQCSATHGGTSAAAPLAAGIYALILEANPELTWRDVQYLTVLSAAEIDPSDGTWQQSAIEGRKYSPKYGWGKIDAEKMVKMAQDNWTLLKPQSWYYAPYKITELEISNQVAEVEDSFTVTSEILKRANFERIEQITVTVDINSGKRGAVEVDLVSPNGIVSQLAVKRGHDKDKMGFRKWSFSSVAHWGETGEGTWKIKVRNTDDTNTIDFRGWQLRIFGECIDPTLAKRFDMNEDYSKINFENENENNSTATTETSIQAPASSQVQTTEATMTSSSSSDTPTFTSEDSDKEHEPVTSTVSETSTTIEPTFSSSSIVAPTTSTDPAEKGSHAQADNSRHYIGYFSALILAGVLFLLFIFKNRRKPGRARRREDFEFDIIHPEDDESSRFEFDDSESSDDEHSHDGLDHGRRRDSEFGVFDNDATSLSLADQKFGKGAKLDDPGDSSEFDLGSSKLSGYDKTDAIIKDAKNKEDDESRVLNAKKKSSSGKLNVEATERSNLVSASATSDSTTSTSDEEQ